MIVEEREIKYVFNTKELNRGDILLMNTYESQRDRMPDCKYDHAAIYLGDAFLIEADGCGVVTNHIYSYGFKEIDHGIALRIKGISVNDIDRVIAFAESQMGKEFSIRQTFMVNEAKKSERVDDSNRTFCSRLVAQSFHYANIDIVDNPDFCSPDDIYNSNSAAVISQSLEEYSSDMKNTIMNYQRYRNEVDEWSISIQTMYQSMKNFYNKDIQTMDQLLDAAVNNLDKDNGALDVLKQQLWMSPPRNHIENYWPWFYNDQDFFSHFNSVEKLLFFLMNQFLHYDSTYLPLYIQTTINISYFAILHDNSKVTQLLCHQFNEILNEAIVIRKRLEYLYMETSSRYAEEYTKFCNQYGEYKYYKYKGEPIDIKKALLSMI